MLDTDRLDSNGQIRQQRTDSARYNSSNVGL